MVDFADCVLFTDPAFDVVPPLGLRIVPMDIRSVEAYSQFMLRGLSPHVQTSHLLVVQWDGFVLDAAAWEESFLDWDYIGAPLRDEPPSRMVGNGGFSLRSRRLLTALQDPSLIARHPEDNCICHDHRKRLESEYGIRFAPPEVAARFSFERLAPTGTTFGFHGLFNFERVMAPDELAHFLASLPAELARGLDAHDLCASLIRRGRLSEAARLLDLRRQLGMRDRRTLRLKWRHAWASWRAGPTPTDPNLGD